MAPAGQSFVRSSPVIPDRNGNLCFVTRCIRQYNAIPRYDANDAVVVSHRDFPVPGTGGSLAVQCGPGRLPLYKA